MADPATTIPPLLASVKAVMRRTGLGRTKIYELIAEGELQPVKVGRRTMFRVDELAAWVERLPRLGGDGSSGRGG
jgi:excisionase family DNA binding protein